MDKKEEILAILSEEWISTTQIKNKLSLNWYIAFCNLIQLQMENKVDKMETARSIFWKLKNET